MSTSRIVINGGVTIDLETVKCFKVSNIISSGKTKFMIIEHKKRYGYIQHPATGEYKKQKYNEVTEVEYTSYESARDYRNIWEDIWQSYLNEKGDQ